MKKALLVLISLVFAAATAFAQPKYGHVNTGLVLESLSVTAEADSLLRMYQDSLQLGFQALELELKTKYEALVKNAPDMTPKAVEAARIELEQIQQEMQAYEQEGARMFEMRRAQLLTPIVDRVMAGIKAYAKTHSYAIIFDSSLPQALLFVDDAQDLTEKIIAELKEM